MIEIITGYTSEPPVITFILDWFANHNVQSLIVVSLLAFMIVGINYIFDRWNKGRQNDKG
jgi:hypothetical protein